MDKNKNLLDHMEQVHGEYIDLVDKIPMEDKLIMSREELITTKLEPWEISEIVQGALHDFPEKLEDNEDLAFDVIYDAISEALERSRR